jgi:hypothetical protein
MSYIAAERRTLGRLLPPWSALMRGIRDIVLAFRVRDFQYAARFQS